MAYGEAEQGCARAAEPGVPRPRAGESAAPCPSAPDPAASRPSIAAEAGAPRPGAVDAVGPQQSATPAEPEVTAGCRSLLPGWAGAHRHGAVRPAHRSVRRDRPPRRWC